MENTDGNLPYDMIIDLPGNAVERILMCLPLRYAVTTSILSKKWRYKWVKIPKLVFDDMLFSELKEPLFYITIIYQVLLLHQGPILKFTLSISRLKEDFFGIDQLIQFMSKNSVQEFTLHITNGQLYKLPLSFFSFMHLTDLDLRSCLFKPPLVFDGFSKLMSLNFNEVEFADAPFAMFTSNCPRLYSLSLKGSLFYNDLKIDAPVLQTLCVETGFSSISFKNTPLLAFLSITSHETSHLGKGELSSITKVFSCLPAIKELHMGVCFLQFLIIGGGVPEQLPFDLNQLKVFQLDNLWFGAAKEVSIVLCLLRSSPNLEKVIISVHEQDVDEKAVVQLIEVQHYSDISFNLLREVHITLFLGAISELDFIKLILAKSPKLEKMIVQPKSKDTSEQLRIVKELTRLKRVSPNAEIVFE